MPGTVSGGQRAAATNKQRYGLDFYRQIGRKGGKISRGGGMAANPELAVRAGRIGGTMSRRGQKISERFDGGFIAIDKVTGKEVKYLYDATLEKYKQV